MNKPIFNSDEQKHEWLLAHPESINKYDQQWLDWYNAQSVGGSESPVKLRQSQD